MENALLIFFITLAFSFCLSYLSVLKKLKQVNVAFVELYLAYTKIEDMIINNDLKAFPENDDSHRENFIKFLSDSREWAFDYIEEAQSTVKEILEYLEKNNNSLDYKYKEKLKNLLGDQPTNA